MARSVVLITYGIIHEDARLTPSHETGILVAHILPYAGSDDTRLCAKLVAKGAIREPFFSGR